MFLGEKLRTLRQIRGYSQEQMAHLLEMSPVTYGNIERNKADVSMSKLEKIAQVLGVTVQDILTFGDKVSNFFDKCEQNNFMVGSGNTQMIGQEEKEWQNMLEKLQLEIKVLEAERDKFRAEAALWQERFQATQVVMPSAYPDPYPPTVILNENPEGT